MKKLIMILFTAITTFAFGCTASDNGVKVISANEFNEIVKTDSNAVILDVRTAGEYAEGHIEGALNLDMKQAEAFEKGFKALDKDKTYYIYCRSGRRSNIAASKMLMDGYKVIDMGGGIIAWKEANLPVVTSAE